MAITYPPIINSTHPHTYPIHLGESVSSPLASPLREETSHSSSLSYSTTTMGLRALESSTSSWALVNKLDDRGSNYRTSSGTLRVSGPLNSRKSLNPLWNGVEIIVSAAKLGERQQGTLDIKRGRTERTHRRITSASHA